MTIDQFEQLVFEAAEESGLFDTYDETSTRWDILECIHAYASMNHSGQGSDLYSILSQSTFCPSRSWSESRVMHENPMFYLVEEIAFKENIT
jgi:hypothetical protein